MALSAAVLKGLIKSKIEAIADFPKTGAHPVFSNDAVLQAFADAIIEHFTSAAVVSVSTPAAQGGSSTLPGTGTVS